MNNDEGTTNHSTDLARRPRPARPPTARVAAAIIGTATLALLAAGCSGSPSSTAARGSPNSDPSSSPSQVHYSDCMRSHAVPRYPDPSDGQLPKGGAQAFGVSSSVFSEAQSACHHLLPNAGSFQVQASQCMLAGDCPPAVVQQMLAIDRKFARCMRSHGVPNWPDPTIGLAGSPGFNLARVGITHAQSHSAPMSNTIAECQRMEGATLTFGLSSR